MGGLNDLDPTSPDGKDLLGGGDNAIRLIITKLKEFAAVEHAMTGEHMFGNGSIAQRPAAAHSGRLYILIVAGVEKELQFDTGSEWVTITSNQVLVNYANNLSTHADASPIDHPDGSISSAKIAAGSLLLRHFIGGISSASVADLFNKSANGNEFHTHAVAADAGETGIVTYTDPGTHNLVVPAGVVRMFFRYAGGGGGGDGGYWSNGGGGGGRGVEKSGWLAVTAGETIELVNGVGGDGGSIVGGGGWSAPTTGHATAGGTTTVPGLEPAVGGGGGNKVAQGGAGGELGGGRGYYYEAGSPDIHQLAEVGESTWNFSGGTADTAHAAYGVGGGGSASLFGNGGDGASRYAVGGYGSQAAGGGGGGGGDTSTWYDGGDGGDGYIQAIW